MFYAAGIQALMSLFVLASKDGWVNIMYHGLDAVGVDQQVVTSHHTVVEEYFTISPSGFASVVHATVYTVCNIHSTKS